MSELEYCCLCAAPTGRGGAGDDSLGLPDVRGPLCEECFDALSEDEDAP